MFYSIQNVRFDIRFNVRKNVVVDMSNKNSIKKHFQFNTLQQNKLTLEILFFKVTATYSLEWRIVGKSLFATNSTPLFHFVRLLFHLVEKSDVR